MYTGIDFLRKVNLGEKPELGSDVAVIGGGNVAIDVARNACRLGSEHVEMFCLESEALMPASEEERREAIEDGVDLIAYTWWGPIDLVSAGTGEMRKRYGFIHVDKYDDGTGTYERRRKDSFFAYQKIIKSNGTEGLA